MSAFLAAVPLIGKVIDKIFPDPAQRDEAKLKLFELQQRSDLAELDAEVQLALAQSATNTEEAKSAHWWVAGARPAIMWICGASLAWSYIFHPMVEWVGFLAGYDISSAPEINAADLMPILVGMLGLGGMRSYDKRGGVETKSIRR